MGESGGPGVSGSRDPGRVLRAAGAAGRVALCGTALALAGCGGEQLPIHEAPLAGDARSARALAGSWYDYAGQLAAEVRTAGAPRLRLALPESYRLERAWVEAGEVYFDVVSDGSPRTGQLWHDEFGEVAAIVRRGGQPSWCGTCSPRLRRYAFAWMADPRLQHLEDLHAEARDALIDKLAEIF